MTSDIQKKRFIDNIRPLFDQKAVYSDGTAFYRNPMEPEPSDVVSLRLRTKADNVDKVYILTDRKRIGMEKEFSKHGFDYFKGEVPIGKDKTFYVFELQIGKLVCYYDRKGMNDNLHRENSFVMVPGYKTPDWAKGAVMYQIYVDRFYNGDITNDVLSDEYTYIHQKVKQVTSWDQMPSTFDVGHFYGGDLAGVYEKLDYLQDLGIEVLYLNPIFVSPSNHKYDTQDYDYIDPHIGKILVDEGDVLEDWMSDNQGASRYRSRVSSLENLEASNQFFIKLVQEIHARGMKIIIDGVFNHCGSFNKWLDREGIYRESKDYPIGAYWDEKSPYRDYFNFEERSWPQNKSYTAWWGHDTLPKLYYEGGCDLEEKILSIGEKWVSPPFNVDGWRLDVAADLGFSPEYNHQFWKKFRKRVKAANPNAIIIAEHYGDASSWLEGDEWDTIMNYDAFMEPVSWFLTGMEKHSDHFREDLFNNGDYFAYCIKELSYKIPTTSRLVAMNQLDNHDHSRFLTRTNHKVGRLEHLGSSAAGENVNIGTLKAGICIQMTWFGAPTLYYGDEVGMVGFTDPDNRRSYPWGKENWEIHQFYKEKIEIHKGYPCIKSGSYQMLDACYGYICYVRFSLDEAVICAINNTDKPMEKRVRVLYGGLAKGDILKRRIEFDGKMSHRDSLEVRVDHQGEVVLMIPAFGGVVYTYEGDA